MFKITKMFHNMLGKIADLEISIRRGCRNLIARWSEYPITTLHKQILSGKATTGFITQNIINQQKINKLLASQYTAAVLQAYTITSPMRTTNTWMGLVFETDQELFKKYIKRMSGHVLICTDHIEEETFAVPKEYAMRYIYAGLKGKFPNTDIEAIDNMEVNDEIQHIRFEKQFPPQYASEAISYDEKSIVEFLIQKSEEELELHTAGYYPTTTTTSAPFSPVNWPIAYSGVNSSYVIPNITTTQSGTQIP